MKLHRAALAGVVLCAAVAAQANVLVYEPFSGYATSTLKGKYASSTTTTGLDTSTAWVFSGDDTGFAATVQTSSLAFGDLAVSSNGSLLVDDYTYNTNKPGLAYVPLTTGHSLSADNTSKDIWVSYLVQFNNLSTFSGAGFLVAMPKGTNYMYAANQDARFITAADDFTSGKTTPAAGTASSLTNGSTALSTGNTYLMVAHFTNTGTSSTSYTANMWAVTPTEFATVEGMAGGISVANLNSTVAIKSGTSSSQTFDWVNSKYLLIAALGNNTGSREKATIDEIRVGESLADVTPTVPEPATLLLVGMGLVGLLRRKN